MSVFISPGTRIVCIVAILIICGGCAQLAPSKIDYRAGVALHSNPRFSFQMPDGWRPATAADISRFTVNARLLSRLNQQGRADLERREVEALTKYAAVMIHDSGAFMSVYVAQNRGTKFSKGVGLTEVERDAYWRLMSKNMVDAAPANDKPKLGLTWMDTTDLPHETALSLIWQQEDLRGTTIWTSPMFFSETHAVLVMHANAPPNEEAGLDGLNVVGRSFRFE